MSQITELTVVLPLDVALGRPVTQEELEAQGPTANQTVTGFLVNETEDVYNLSGAQTQVLKANVVEPVPVVDQAWSRLLHSIAAGETFELKADGETVMSLTDVGLPHFPRGFSFPVVADTTARDALPVVSGRASLAYVTADTRLYVYNGTSWEIIA